MTIGSRQHSGRRHQAARLKPAMARTSTAIHGGKAQCACTQHGSYQWRSQRPATLGTCPGSLCTLQLRWPRYVGKTRQRIVLLPGQLGWFSDQLMGFFFFRNYARLGISDVGGVLGHGLVSSPFGCCLLQTKRSTIFFLEKKEDGWSIAPPPRDPACSSVRDGGTLVRSETEWWRMEASLGWACGRRWAEPELIHHRNGLLDHRPVAACLFLRDYSLGKIANFWRLILRFKF